MAHAGPSEMVVANTYFQKLDEADQAGFEELAPIDCRNTGLIKSRKLRLGGPTAPHYALDETARPPAVSEPPTACGSLAWAALRESCARRVRDNRSSCVIRR